MCAGNRLWIDLRWQRAGGAEADMLRFTIGLLVGLVAGMLLSLPVMIGIGGIILEILRNAAISQRARIC